MVPFVIDAFCHKVQFKALHGTDGSDRDIPWRERLAHGWMLFAFLDLCERYHIKATFDGSVDEALTLYDNMLRC